ncbi:hypothetical protein ElyMa_006421300 [Elysia marginata]|uniref:Uncharacterized protein n=1 Tax=Elysia marginata TaxID=1093978 RepID=A0AAV4HTB2_9GAST|nr:hypothetical protein ElyMa_006421300 [Elysia marginata]
MYRGVDMPILTSCKCNITLMGSFSKQNLKISRYCVILTTSNYSSNPTSTFGKQKLKIRSYCVILATSNYCSNHFSSFGKQKLSKSIATTSCGPPASSAAPFPYNLENLTELYH